MSVPLPDSFAYREIDADGVRIHCAVAGNGPPVLLLHGYPQTHLIWHEVAPRLAAEHTVVLTDLRGYGDSAKPAAGPDHAEYAKRAMAADQVTVMRRLGFDSFAVAGHDRGARVGHRLALDHPAAVTRLAVLDIVPTLHVFDNVDIELGLGYFHWFFLAAGDGIPEKLLGAEPEFWIRNRMSALGGNGFDPTAVDEYVRCFSDPAAISASCEDYRAAASIDLVHDRADAESRTTVDVPLLVLWGEQGFVGTHYDPLDVWRGYATDVRGHALPCGHYLPEEQPGRTADALLEFLTD